MTTRKKREAWDATFAVKTGLAGFNAFLQVTDPELAEFNRAWEAEVTVAAERLVVEELARQMMQVAA